MLFFWGFLSQVVGERTYATSFANDLNSYWSKEPDELRENVLQGFLKTYNDIYREQNW